jgi:DNA-binding MarR family transcriptional regulator
MRGWVGEEWLAWVMSYAKDMPTVEMASRTDAGLASELRLSVMRLRRRLTAERHPDNELSMGAMSVLGCLFRMGELTVGELASHERVQPPSMTRTVNALDEGGYIVRRKHDTDGRQVVVALSERGRTTLLADRDRRDAWLAQRLTGLTAGERDVLRRAAPILERLATSD